MLGYPISPPEDSFVFFRGKFTGGNWYLLWPRFRVFIDVSTSRVSCANRRWEVGFCPVTLVVFALLR